MALGDDVHATLASTRVQLVRELALGSVSQLRGAVRAMELLEAPLSRNSCVYWAVHVFEKGLLGGWELRHRIEAARDFEVVDESGTAVVLVEGATVAATRSGIARISRRHDVPVWLDDFTQAHGIETREIERSDGRVVGMRNKELELRETRLRAGDVVRVLGNVVALGADPGPAPGSYRGVSQRRALVSGPRSPLLIGAIEDG